MASTLLKLKTLIKSSNVTFSRYGPYWRQARRICVTELLSHKRVSSFRAICDSEVNRVVSTLMRNSGTDVDLSKLLFDLANNVVCKAALGRNFGQDGKLVDVLKETHRLFTGFCLGNFVPELGWVNSVSGYKRRCMENLNELRIVCDQIINEDLEKKEEKSNEEDFVDVLLRVQKRDDLDTAISGSSLSSSSLKLTQ